MLERVAKQCRANNSLWLSHPEYATISLKIDDAGQLNYALQDRHGNGKYTSLYHVFWCWIVRKNHLRQVEAQYQQQAMFANIIKTVIQ